MACAGMLTLSALCEERKFDNESPDAHLEQPHVTDAKDLGDADTAIKRAGGEEAQPSTDLEPERLTTGFEKLDGMSEMEGACAGLEI